MTEQLLPIVSTVAVIVAAMAVVAAVERTIPLRALRPWNAKQIGPNLAMTLITLAMNVLLALPLIGALMWMQTIHFGLLRVLTLPAWAATALGIVLLDFATYGAHLAMHRFTGLWRFHRMHHSDPVVDVSTALRQHPGETLIRFGFIAVAAVVLGTDPNTLALYRAWSAVTGLQEHANVRLPAMLDWLLTLVIVSPNMHKVHHVRVEAFANSNYGNIFSIFDRLLGSFTPAQHGADGAYGLEGFDDPEQQTITALLALPFRDAGRPSRAVLTRRQAA